MSLYQTPVNSSIYRCEIKKSRFIGIIEKAQDKQAVMQAIERLHQQYPDARHICSAFIIGDPNNSTNAGFNDDGEPSGTAGRPMLNVLQQNNIGDAVAIVVRYFGGIKLGAGGLVRAYSGAISSSLKELSLESHQPQSSFKLNVSYAIEDAIRRALQKNAAQIIQQDYGNDVQLHCILASDKVENLTLELQNIAKGDIEITNF